MKLTTYIANSSDDGTRVRESASVRLWVSSSAHLSVYLGKVRVEKIVRKVNDNEKRNYQAVNGLKTKTAVKRMKEGRWWKMSARGSVHKRSDIEEEAF
ncbi:hypothetical protein E2C01_007701 [Portunus trituberculatus]|uniref:Uncharacterized protein n=1 Tax=Portunus trituberculatus TaxID=210409 RepID=A0A5B7D4P5_PORTR|nr:hypothetical protein [Portunus trituberculatus]